MRNHGFNRLKRTTMNSLWTIGSLTGEKMFTEEELVDSGCSATPLIEIPNIGFCNTNNQLVIATQFTCVHSKDPVIVVLFVYGKMLLILSDGPSASRFCELEYPHVGGKTTVRSYPIYRVFKKDDGDDIVQQVIEDLVISRRDCTTVELTTECVLW